MIRRVVAGLVAAAVAGTVGWAVVASPAAAHNTLRSTNPAADATVAATPDAIVLTFDEPAIAMGTRVVVTGPAGPIQAGAPQLVDNTVTQPLQPGAPAGRYVVSWRVTSADGHPIDGTYAFTSSAAGTASPTPGPPSTPADPPAGGSGWAALVALLVLVGVLAGMLYAFRRARSVTGPRYDRSASAPGQGDVDPTESRTESRPPSDE